MVALAAVAAVAVAALAVSVWQLARPRDRTVVTVAARTTVAAPRKRDRTVAPTPAVARAEPSARLILSAMRGACWLEVRSPGRTGRVLYAGTLDQGRSVRFARRHLWVAFGAGGNLEATLNGRPVGQFPAGTAAVVVTAAGIGPPAPL